MCDDNEIIWDYSFKMENRISTLYCTNVNNLSTKWLRTEGTIANAEYINSIRSGSQSM
jgi:hypothetical protein